MGLVTVTIKVVDGAASPIDGVTCRVFTDPGDVFVTQGVTGNPTPSSGEAEVTLNGAVTPVPYFVRLSKNGVSFLPSATVNIAVKDPTPPANLFTFTGTIGETSLVVQIVVKDNQVTPQPVEDVRIRVFDAGDLFVTELDTDAAGEADVVLDGVPDPGLNYIIRLFKSGWQFTAGVTQVIQVQEPLVSPETNIFDIEASTPVIPESSHPDMCLISGFIGNSARQPLNKVQMRFLPQLKEPTAFVSGFPFPGDPTVVDGVSLVSDVKFGTNEAGYIEILLPRAGFFDCHIYGLETPGVQIIQQIYIPDAASARLEDILFPYVVSLEWDLSSIALAVGETAILTPTLVTSNLQTIVNGTAIESLMNFASDDEAVASVVLQEDGTLSITALKAGSANISGAREADTWAPRRPPVDALVITPVVTVPVTVT